MELFFSLSEFVVYTSYPIRFCSRITYKLWYKGLPREFEKETVARPGNVARRSWLYVNIAPDSAPKKIWALLLTRRLNASPPQVYHLLE